MSIRLMVRDRVLLGWMNKMGFVTLDQICKKFNIAKRTAYGRLQKLIAHELIIHQRLFHNLGTYRASQLGVQLSGSELPPLKRLPPATFYHDQQVTNLSLALMKRFGGDYISEWQLRYENNQNGFGESSHIPDGILILDDKQMAIEVELNQKSKRRREHIFDYYIQRFDYKAVWYFCANKEIERQILPYTEKLDFFKTFMLSEFIPF